MIPRNQSATSQPCPICHGYGTVFIPNVGKVPCGWCGGPGRTVQLPKKISDKARQEGR